MVTPSPSLPLAPHTVALFSTFGDALPFSPSYSVTCEKGISNMPSVGTKLTSHSAPSALRFGKLILVLHSEGSYSLWDHTDDY